MPTLLWLAASLVLGGCTDESGPGELRSFVALGTTGGTAAGIEPAWLDNDGGTTMAEALVAAGDSGAIEDRPLEEALAALDGRAPDHGRRAAFILLGCGETGAELTIDGPVVRAELTSGGHVQCVVPNYFLAVFEIPDDAIPHGAQLQV